MPRVNATVPPDAIRIEDEVWQEAFSRREPPRGNRRRLHAIEGGRSGETAMAPPASWTAAAPPEPSASAALESPARAPVPGLRQTPLPARPSTPEPVVRTAPAGQTPAAPGTPIPGRRTVTIQGRGAERHLPRPEAARRRPPRRAYERAGFRPDRLAMWAVLLGFVLVLVAIASAHG